MGMKNGIQFEGYDRGIDSRIGRVGYKQRYTVFINRHGIEVIAAVRGIVDIQGADPVAPQLAHAVGYDFIFYAADDYLVVLDHLRGPDLFEHEGIGKMVLELNPVQLQCGEERLCIDFVSPQLAQGDQAYHFLLRVVTRQYNLEPVPFEKFKSTVAVIRPS